ncbi:SPOR domain-containing protein [Sphingobacteriales bacterium UPWRP_1]|nr:hypothetical protein BVG80_06325 [Sphingobacteriales bacterium TSM_CSM]PSJ78024.1 SPOR domain-containing protein [Sphingobacteriales bacterium UPWRP_1]
MAKKVNIVQYIQSLLYDYSSVVVPGLGAFLTQYAPARIRETDGVVLPPVKTVQFNEKLNLNDGLLISHIARMEKIAEGEAGIYVSHFVDNIFDQFANGEPAVLEGIGTLSKTLQGIAFTPFADANFSSDTYGLTPVELPPVTEEEGTAPADLPPPPVGTGMGMNTDVYEEPEDETPVTVVETTEKRSLHEVLASTGSNTNETTQIAANAEQPEAPPAKKTNYWWWLLPVFMLLAFIILLSQLPSGKKQQDTAQTDSTNNAAAYDTSANTAYTGSDSAAATTTGSTDNANNANNTAATGSATTATGTTTGSDSDASTGNVRGNATTETTGTAATTTDNRGNATTTATTTTGTASTSDNRGNATETTAEAPAGYYVIVASYDVQSKANKLALKLSNASGKVYALPPDKGRYRVGYYAATESAAKTEMDRLKKSGYPQAWILKR